VTVDMTPTGQPDQQYGQIFADWWEAVPALMFPENIRTYGRMRHDPQLAGILRGVGLPIEHANWMIEPGGARDEVVQRCSDDLGLPIAGSNDESDAPDPVTDPRKAFTWARHLEQALAMLWAGFAPFEAWYMYDDQSREMHLANVGQRMPWTVAHIKLNHDSSIEEITQTTQQKPIPAHALRWYALGQEGANWPGISLLRPAFAPWLLKHELWRVIATSSRRFGMGVPTVEAPAGSSAGQITMAQQLASSMRAGNTTGAGLPNGYKFSLTGLSGSVPDTLGFVKYLDQQMSKMALAGVIDLGQTEVGSRALGETFLDLFILAVQSIANKIAAQATAGWPGETSQGIPGIVTDLVTTAFGDDEECPRIVCSDVGENHVVTAQAMQLLTQFSAVVPDEKLDEHLRKLWHLPQRDPDAPAPLPGTPDTLPPGSPGAPPAVPAPAAVARLSDRRPRIVRAAFRPRRKLSDVERAAGFDPGSVRHDFEQALNSLLTAWPDLYRAQRNQLVEQVAKAVEDDDTTRLAALTVDTADAAAALGDALENMATTAASRMIREADSQGVKIDAADAPLPTDRLQAIAKARTTMHGSYLAAQAGQRALQLAPVKGAQPGAGNQGPLPKIVKPAKPHKLGTEVADYVREWLDALSQKSLSDQLGAALMAAQNAGRIGIMAAAPESAGTAEYVATEFNDDNTCEPCTSIDGTIFTDLAEADATYANGGYVDCDGGLRCRGTVVASWSGQDVT
jgi:hypothetical protein